jgi:signal transduction histidine kinase
VPHFRAVRLRVRLIVAGTLVAATAATLLPVIFPSLHVVHRAPGLRVALEGAASLMAATAAYIALGRFLRARSLGPLVLGVALTFLAAATFALAVLVAVTPAWDQALVLVVTGNLVGGVGLALAAFVPDRPVRRPARDMGIIVAAGLALAAITALAFVLFAWDGAAQALREAEATGSNRADRAAGLLSFQVLTLAAFAAAALGFGRTALRTGDEFLGWLALATTLGAFSRVSLILFPAAGTHYIHLADVFRVLFYVVLLVAAAREVNGYWKTLADTAVLEERRRIARDMHDGLAQELAYISRRAKRLAQRPSAEGAEQIAASAERALTESRRAIAALTRPLDEPLDEVLAQAVEEVAQRTGARLELELDPGIEVAGPAREALVRIACEAVANAARHSRASVVRLELANGDRVLLRVVDDGVGFDTAGAPESGGGFGLESMRGRAAALGADFRLRSEVGTGTTVEVELA